jgi:hypothetical protein
MEPGWIMAAGVLATAGVVVAIAIRTGWMQSGTMRKCVVLAGVVHLALAIVAALIGGLAPASWGTSATGRTTMVMVLEEFPSCGNVLPARPSEDGAGAASEETAPPPSATEPVRPTESDSAGMADDPVPPSIGTETRAGPSSVAALSSQALESAIVPLLDRPREEASATAAAVGADHLADGLASAQPRPLPAPYADRARERRAVAAAARGGSLETERAVEGGLDWLCRTQSADGRWNAARHGATVERSSDGVDRQGAGARCDNGVTALALLAFLGAGSTHLDGPHATRVARGMEFLLAGQAADGSLAGDAEFFTALYCHGMGTIALAEAAAMSGDRRLLEPLGRAVGHIRRLQHPSTGGWRYAAGDLGDTSQLGWQVMALSSARLAGITDADVPLRHANRFLPGVSGGQAGGLACYRPGERFNPTMTAEALLCRLLLGATTSGRVVDEAVRAIAASPPEVGTVNLYRWYYSTLALYHVGGPEWERWNGRLQPALVDLQRRGGPLDGSWDPDPVWGGHGGRVYSTALSVMTLEIYYRYLPMHALGPRDSVSVPGI